MGKAIKPLYATVIAAGIASTILLICMLTGNFSINDTNRSAGFGVYDNYLTDAARLNPLWETIGNIEGLTLLLLPIVLIIGRLFIKPLQSMAILSWAMALVGLLFAVFLWPMHFGWDNRPFNTFTMSELPTLLQMQIPIIAGIVVGVYLTKREARTKAPEQ